MVRALVYGVAPAVQPDEVDPTLPEGERRLAVTPMALQDVEPGELPGPDWVRLRTRMTGICGSDTKQVLADGDPDNAMTALISFPQVLGHEVVAEVAEVGADASGLDIGQRVLLNPWLSCAPRGIAPVCPACADGDLSLCHNFAEGRLQPGIHVGNSADAPGGFGEFLPAHASMCIPLPDDVPDEVAVLADPFSVSLHAVTRNPPPDGGTAVVYGIGALGTTTLEILRALHPGVQVLAVCQHPHQAALAQRLGATAITSTSAGAIVAAVGDATGARVRTPFLGAPMLQPGGADVVYDTVASTETLEVGVRITRPRGTMVLTGVATPGRFEWTPWYFKELRLVGSNAFGIEEVDGLRQHAMQHYLDLVRAGRIDLDGMLTHTYRLEDWREAFTTILRAHETGAVKVAFDLR